MIRLVDLLIESKADEIESKIRQSFLMNRGSFNTGWKMPKRAYIGLIKGLKKQYGSLVDKIVKELEKFDYIEPIGSQVVWNESTLTEGVNDPGIFKAVFLAGGPGSGKTYVAKQLFGIPDGFNISIPGMKMVNSDKELKYLLNKYGFGTDLDKMPDEVFKDLTASGKSGLRKFSKELTAQRMKLYQQGKLGMIIDGTGHDYNKLAKMKRELEQDGYDTFMLFIMTPLEVAQKRNQMRDRILPPKLVEKSYNEVMQNAGKYKSLFGSSNIQFMSNSVKLSYWEAQAKFSNIMRKEIGKFIKNPIKNPIAKKWIEKQQILKKQGK